MGWEYNNYLAHHGVKGQKWGVRRFQNEDGTAIRPVGQRTRAQTKESSETDNEAMPRPNTKKWTARRIIRTAGQMAMLGVGAAASAATSNVTPFLLTCGAVNFITLHGIKSDQRRAAG